MVDRISAVMWNLRPAEAVMLGKHEYDGVVPDATPDEIDAQVRRLRTLLEGLDGLEGLDAEQRFDRLQLRAAVRGVLFSHEVLRTHRRNPLRFVDALDVTPYLTRAYAPAPLRALRAAEVLEQAPRLLEQARTLLDPVLPEVFCRWGIEMAAGMAESLRRDVAGWPGGAEDPEAAAALAAAAETGASALRSFAAWLRDERVPASDDGFPIGAAALEEMVAAAEALPIGAGRMLEIAEADLAENLAAFRETAARLDPDLEPRAVYERYVASEQAEPGSLVPAVREMLEGIRSFVVERGLVTVPSEVRARVALTPPHLRWAFAMMDTPGPYETAATEAYYYVTPPEEEWPPEQSEQWMRALNTFALEDISIHEAYPGHYVHFLHFRSAPTETSRRTASYAFVEGWAHYAEQMVWEAGYREGDPRFRLAQLSEALVRNCRFVCSLRMHGGDMTLPEAIDFFRHNAFYDERPARSEAERGTFDPGYLSYTLGKLEILALRDRVAAAQGSGFDLREFHDRLLGRGAPPIGLIDRLVTV